jgi:hypothetical protein
VSAHFYVDGDSVTQALDTDRKAGHAGSAYGNNNAIAIEVTGVNAWTRGQWLERVAWNKLGAVIAYIVQHDPDYAGWQNRRASVAEMRSNPRVKALYGHDDMRQAWGGTTHTDPGPNFPWDRLIQAIGDALAGGKPSGGTGMSEWHVGATPAGLRDDQVTQGPVDAQGRPVWPNGQQRDTVIAWGAYYAQQTASASTAILDIVTRLAAVNPDVDDSDVEAIKEAARAGVAQGLDGFRDQLVSAVVDALPNGGGSAGGYTLDEFKAALRSVFADAGTEG